MFEDLVGDQAAELAGAGDQDRLRPMPARQRRSSTSRMSSRDAKVSATFSTRKIAQTELRHFEARP